MTASAAAVALAALPLVAEYVPSDPFGQVLVAVVAAAAVVLVGRLLLSVAWKLLMMAAVVASVLYALSLAGALA